MSPSWASPTPSSQPCRSQSRPYVEHPERETAEASRPIVRGASPASGTTIGVMGHGQANPSPMTFQDIGAGCAPQDHRVKSRLLGSRRQGGRLPAHGRVPGMTSREAGLGESACDSNKPRDLVKGGRGRGVATVKPTPAPYQGQAWPQHAVLRKISVRRGTVALPALTSAQQYRVLRPRQLV